MIIGLLIMGLMLISSALKNTQHELGARIASDLIGPQGFIVWIGAIMAIGAIGYIPGLRTTSRALLALLFVVVVVRNGGVFAQAQAALASVSRAGPAPSIPTLAPETSKSSSSSGSSSSSSSGSSSGSSDSTLSTVASVAAIALL